MLTQYALRPPEGLRQSIADAYRMDERTLMTELIDTAKLESYRLQDIRNKAMFLVEQVRTLRKKTTGIDSFLTQYSLSSAEGIALMCLAEALLRVPDNATIDKLIKDKLTGGNWKSHLGQSDSFFVNATTWALMLTGKVLTPERADTILSKALFKLINRSGEGVVRKAVDAAMRIMSKQFVTGRTIEEALSLSKKKQARGYRFSYDMLGEAALTEADAQRYFEAYKKAIQAIGKSVNQNTTLYERPGISIKLSALHPRYNEAQAERVMKELPWLLLQLSQLAKQYGIALTIDAEESERLDLSLDIIEKVFTDKSLDGWNGFGIAVQSYQKRAFYLIDWLAQLARNQGRRMMVRLIKGAYWDSEIKKAQMQGLSEYPVFTRKAFTDVSFQACAKKLLSYTDVIYPQFATHNAYSVAVILNLVGDYRDFEFQCLHGMGNELYEQIVPSDRLGIPCRIYAPVGSHEDLLPYLVRRLLENGANSSFVNRIVDESAPISSLVEDPVGKAHFLLDKMNENIPLPNSIFLPERKNSTGLDFTDRNLVIKLQNQYSQMELGRWLAKPLIGGKEGGAVLGSVTSPNNTTSPIGQVSHATRDDLEFALQQADKAFLNWSQTPVSTRITCINSFATLLEENRSELLALLALEAGKTLNDGVGEIREAIDFSYYYNAEAHKLMAQPRKLQGYTGELNELSLHPRGTIACISPWNFPLAIFVGQVVAALVTGNCVIAKPAEQTPMVAHFAIRLMHKAGIPPSVVQLLPGSGELIGAQLVADQRIKGVIFTGSTQTASLINQSLAMRGGPIIPLIAETGGQNAMIVDSSALLEQVTLDAITSAFGSAGQRCSALRVLFIQEEIYPRLIQLLKGAMGELIIGDPSLLSTDIGPVIDNEALAGLKEHVQLMSQHQQILYQCELPKACHAGYYMPPTLIEINDLSALKKEVFGPILHVIKYKRNQLDRVIAQINETGYGLTVGIHSRINQTIEYIRTRIHAGNCYVNRNMIGAVVGLQPFGGEGLSGTGPKAGGPYYLPRLCLERTYTVDTTAAGGNASLMSLPEGY